MKRKLFSLIFLGLLLGFFPLKGEDFENLSHPFFSVVVSADYGFSYFTKTPSGWKTGWTTKHSFAGGIELEERKYGLYFVLEKERSYSSDYLKGVMVKIGGLGVSWVGGSDSQMSALNIFLTGRGLSMVEEFHTGMNLELGVQFLAVGDETYTIPYLSIGLEFSLLTVW